MSWNQVDVETRWYRSALRLLSGGNLRYFCTSKVARRCLRAVGFLNRVSIPADYDIAILFCLPFVRKVLEEAFR